MPYYQTTIHTTLWPAEVEERLQRLTRARGSWWNEWLKQWDRSRDEARPFVGTVGAGRFVLEREIGYRNSFLPTIRGTIEHAGSYTDVKLRMHIHPAVAVFILVWVLLLARSVSVGFPDRFLFGMIAFAPLLTCAGFYPEALYAAHILRKALQQ